MPHADTLARLLKVIDVSEIQECMVELIKDLIKRKKFRNYLYKSYIIAIDGTQKMCRNWQWMKMFRTNCRKRKQNEAILRLCSRIGIGFR